MMRFCQGCGKPELNNDAVFCLSCGTKLPPVIPAAQPVNNPYPTAPMGVQQPVNAYPAAPSANGQMPVRNDAAVPAAPTIPDAAAGVVYAPVYSTSPDSVVLHKGFILGGFFASLVSFLALFIAFIFFIAQGDNDFLTEAGSAFMLVGMLSAVFGGIGLAANIVDMKKSQGGYKVLCIIGIILGALTIALNIYSIVSCVGFLS